MQEHPLALPPPPDDETHCIICHLEEEKEIKELSGDKEPMII
jgi:hypothetical protein